MNILDKLFGKKVAVQGDKKLAAMSQFIKGQIAVTGVNETRRRVIKSIEDDCLKVSKKHLKVNRDCTLAEIMQDELIQTALKTPAYMDMLKALGMNSDHIETLARQQWLKAKKEGAYK